MSVRRHLQIVASNGRPVEDSCFHRTDGLDRTDQLGLDQADLFFLRLFRTLCVSLFCNAGDGAPGARAFAVEELGEGRGARAFNQCVDLIYAIRTARKSDFAFMPPDCPVCSRHISDEEWVTVRLVRAARREDSVCLMRHAGTLTDGRSMIGVGLAARMLGEQLGAHPWLSPSARCPPGHSN